MKTVIADIEANGLLETITKVYVIACVDADGSNEKVFTSEDCGDRIPDGTLEDGVKYLMQYDRIVMHNLCGYNTHVLNRFFPHLWSLKTVPFKKHWDTLVQSKAQHFDRPRLKGTKSNHGLEYYGVLFKYPKPPIEDWSYWDAEKLNRVLVDIEINRKVYHYLNNEAQKTGVDFSTQIRRTQAAQYWYTYQEMYGWMADKKYMESCVEDLDNIIEGLKNEIEPKLPKQVKPKAPKCTWEDIRDKWKNFYQKVPKAKVDLDTGKPIKEAYMPTLRVFLKSGKYDKHTANHFGIDQDPEKSGRLVRGPYTKIEIHDSKMSQHAVVKDYLLSIGWRPIQWNYQKDKDGKLERDAAGNLIKKSPKLTEDSFDSIEGELGKKIAHYNTYVHRRRTMKNEKDSSKGWLNQLRKDTDRIPAGAMAWATSTGRAAQFGIVNVPSVAALYGEPMRRSWICPEDKVLVSVDMDSAQIRILANYMGDDEYTQAVTEGQEFDENHRYVATDAHTLHSIAFGTLPQEMVDEARRTQDEELIKKCSAIRKKGKNGYYCLIFGGGDAKLATTLGLKTAKEGAKIKESMFKRLPKLGELQKRLKAQCQENEFRGGGYIQVAGGTWVWCPSDHKLLNYLLMGSEAVIQNEAICWANMQIRKRELSGKQLAAVHDEITFEFDLAQEDIGLQLLTEMYGQASKKLGMDVIVTGTAQSGRNWADIH